MNDTQGWSNLPDSHAPPLESPIEVEARLGGDVAAFDLLAVDGGGRTAWMPMRGNR